MSLEWGGEGSYQVQVTAIDPHPIDQQLKLFSSNNFRKRKNLCIVMDSINGRYGEFTLTPARLLYRSDMPNVIAPGWKPFGHRQTI